MTEKPKKMQEDAGSSGINRRKVLQRGATFAAAGVTAGLTGLPYISKTSAFAQNKTLKFWQFYGPGGPQKTADTWIQKLVSDWNDSHDTKVESVYVPSSQYVGTKLPTAFASGEGPDIFIMADDVLRYYNGDVLQDLTPHIVPKVQADFPDAVIDVWKVGGKIYGIPMEVAPMAMYYSVKAFEDAGLNENDVPKTWDQMLELAKKLTTSDRYGVLFTTVPGGYQNFTWYPFMWQGGGEIQTAEGKSGFDSPAVVQALKFWQDAIKSGAAPRQMLGGGGANLSANLGSGYCAMQNVGIWGMGQMKNNAPDVPYGIFRLPTPENGKYVTIGGGWAFVANAKGQDPETAAEFCAWALASSDKGSINRVLDWCTVATTQMPPRRSVLEAGKAIYSKGGLGVFASEIYPGTRTWPRLPKEITKIISDAIQETMLGSTDPQAAAASASQLIDGFLASYNGVPIV